MGENFSSPTGPGLSLHAGAGGLGAVAVHLDDGLGKGLGSFLRQVVTDTAVNEAVRILAGEFVGVGTGFGCGAPLASPSSVMVGTPMTGNSASRLSSSSYFAFAVRQAEAPAVIVDRDADVIRVVEGGGAALERGVVEVPFRRGGAPDQPGEARADTSRNRPGRARWRSRYWYHHCSSAAGGSGILSASRLPIR